MKSGFLSLQTQKHTSTSTPEVTMSGLVVVGLLFKSIVILPCFHWHLTGIGSLDQHTSLAMGGQALLTPVCHIHGRPARKACLLHAADAHAQGHAYKPTDRSARAHFDQPHLLVVCDDTKGPGAAMGTMQRSDQKSMLPSPQGY